MYRLFWLILLLLSFPGFSYAETSALIVPVDRFYHWANGVYGSGHGAAISSDELKKNLEAIFTPDVVHYLNGKKVASGIADLQKRFLTLGDRYASVDVALPYEDSVMDARHAKISIRYSIQFISKNQQSKTLHAISIFHIKNNKISEFDEVSSVQEDHL